MNSNSNFEKRKIPVIVDKSHLITIGEKLYTEKSSFIRELVNNAYDADATMINVVIKPKTIHVHDNGSGMDESGLRKYFTIGASEKKSSDRSPRFARKRIGEFGIGKFSALSACKRFVIETQKNQFHAILEFDKESWTGHDDWHLNINILPFDPVFKNGTRITLHDLSINFAPGKVRRYLAERTPIHAPNFTVFINQERVSDQLLTGKRVPVDMETEHGKITGTLVIAPANSRASHSGIGVYVKEVLVRYEQFGLANSMRFGSSRITGRLNADFLPVTSGRDDFIRDSIQYLSFISAVKKQLVNVFKDLKKEGDRKANLQASRVLKNSLHKIGKAMRRRQDLFPKAQVPFGDENSNFDSSSQAGYNVSQAKYVDNQDQLDKTLNNRLKQNHDRNKKRSRQAVVLGNKSIIRNLRIANMDIAVRLDHLGIDEDESILSGGIIYINLDHPLYRTYRDNDELLSLHITRILTKELTLSIDSISAAQAFSIQSELLTDALKRKGA